MRAPRARAASAWKRRAASAKMAAALLIEMSEQEVRDQLKFLAYAPVVFVSASTGRNVEGIFDLVTQVAAERRKRISTSEMIVLSAVDFERASVPVSKQVKIYYMTQAGVSPPKFILFTDRAVKLHFAYERFLENQIRRALASMGLPSGSRCAPALKLQIDGDTLKVLRAADSKRSSGTPCNWIRFHSCGRNAV